MRKTPLSSSTGGKILIAITGLAIFGFLVTHLAGNLIVFGGRETFNEYAHKLGGTPLIWVIDAGLLALFLTHIIKTGTNFLNNRSKRPVSYYKKTWAGSPSKKTVASSTMIVTGIITIAFLIVHIQGLRFGAYYHAQGGVRDLYRTEMEHFSNPVIVGFYVLSMGVIGFHLWHGFWSAFQSLGLGNSRFTPRLMGVAKAVSIFISVGFAMIPLWAYLSGAAARSVAEHASPPPAAVAAQLSAPGTPAKGGER